MRRKNWLWTALAASLIAAGASFFFIFPAAADNILQNGAAIASQSWQMMFGGDNAAEDFASGTDASASGTDSLASLNGDSGGNGDANDGDENISADRPLIFASTLPPAASPKAVPPPPSPRASPLTSPPPAASVSPSASPSPPVSPCVMPPSPNLSSKIILNEIAWMGSIVAPGETAAAAGEREWMELKNISGVPVNLAGWQVMDASGNIKIILNADAAIAPGGFYFLARGAAGASTTIAGDASDEIYSGALANGGDVLAIFDPSCGVSDFLDASSGWPAGNNTTKQTLERDTDDLGWHTSVSPGGTPRAENSVIPNAPTSTIIFAPPATSLSPTPPPGGTITPLPTPAPMPSITPAPAPIPSATPTPALTATPAPVETPTSKPISAPSPEPTGTISAAPPDHLVIAAVAVAGASSSNDFVKIFNPTAASMSLDGWKLRKKTNTGSDDSLKAFGPGDSVASDAYFVWANSENGFGDAFHANATSTATLAADNSVALVNASGTEVDAVGWGTGADQYVEGSAFPADPDAGQILARKFADGVILDTGNNATDFIIQ